MECKNKSDTSNNKGNRNHFKITQTIPEQHTGKALNQGTTKNSHIWHSTHTTESANIKVQNIFQGEITLHVALTVNTEQLQYCIS